MRYFVFCHECAQELDPDNIAGIFWAKYGPQMDDDVEGAILVCPPWDEFYGLHGGEQFVCDECPQIVAVHPTSKWFIDAHRNEREEA